MYYVIRAAHLPGSYQSNNDIIPWCEEVELEKPHLYLAYHEDDICEACPWFASRLRCFPIEIRTMRWTYRQLKEAGLI